MLSFILVVYGLVNIIVNENILRKPINWLRNKNSFIDGLLGCPTCSAYWVGMLLYPLFSFGLSNIFLIDILLSGFLASGSINLIEYIKIRLM